MIRNTRISFGWCMAMAGTALLAQAAGVTWDAGGADNRWSTLQNWSDNVNGVQTDDHGRLDGTAYGTSVMDLASPFRVAELRVVRPYAETVNGHVVNLDGRTLEAGELLVGRSEAGMAVGGSLAVTNGTVLVNGNLRVGYLDNGLHDDVTGNLAIQRSGALQLGNGASVYVGYRSAHDFSGWPAAGALSASGALQFPSLDRLWVGVNASQKRDSVAGVLNASTAEFLSGIAANSVRVGYGAGTTPNVLYVGSCPSLTARDELLLGYLNKASGGYVRQSTSQSAISHMNITIGDRATGHQADLIAGYASTEGDCSAEMIVRGGVFDACLRNLIIGGYGPSANKKRANATLDIDGMTVAGGSLETDVLQIGMGKNAVCNLYLGSSLTSLVVRLSAEIGRHGKARLQQSASVPSLSGTHLRIGSPGARAPLYVSYNTLDDPGVLGSGSFGLAGGSVTAYLTELMVGRAAISTANKQVQADGTLDLGSAPIRAFDVAGDIWVGHGYLSFGRLSLGAGDGSASRLVVGDANVLTGDQRGTYGGWGRVELRGTRLSLSNGAAIDVTGTVSNFLSGASSGVSIESADPAALSIAPGGRYVCVYTAAAASGVNDYWCLRMVGSHVARFDGLLADGRITVDRTALSPSDQMHFGIYEKGGYTYLGIRRPPTGTTLLLR